MKTAEILNQKVKTLDDKIKKLLEDFIAENGNFKIEVKAYTYHSDWTIEEPKMYAISNTTITL